MTIGDGLELLPGTRVRTDERARRLRLGTRAASRVAVAVPRRLGLPDPSKGTEVSDDVLSEFEPLIDAAEAVDTAALDADPMWSPWARNSTADLLYEPNLDLLVDLLTGPMSVKASTQSGRLAKAFDAWMAYELRRGNFDAAEVWPRNRSPRIFSKDLVGLRDSIALLTTWVADRDAECDAEARKLEDDGHIDAVTAADDRLEREQQRLQRLCDRRLAAYVKKSADAKAKGKALPAPVDPLVLPTRVPVQSPLMPGLRQLVAGVASAMPNSNATNVLGRFYVKQVDVVVASWDRGPDVLISGKTMFSSFAKNTKNRYEETLGEASNLRDRYPLAAMGYAFLVSDKIFGEAGAYGRMQDLLLRTRKPHGPYDATMLLIATWDAETGTLALHDPMSYPDPAVSGQQPPVDLSPARFFTDLLNTVITNTPVGVHEDVRVLRNGSGAPGGTPHVTDAAEGDSDESDDY